MQEAWTKFDKEIKFVRESKLSAKKGLRFKASIASCSIHLSLEAFLQDLRHETWTEHVSRWTRVETWSNVYRRKIYTSH